MARRVPTFHLINFINFHTKIMIYTKTGDNGTTALMGGKRVPKNSVRLHAYGTVDELNSFLGLLKTKVGDEHRATLLDIQQTLFAVGANLATDTTDTPLHESAKISAEKVHQLEKNIDKMTENLPKLTHFIVYGDNEASAICHICRAVARRAERAILDIENQQVIDAELKKYMNRLSDFLFVLARTLANEKCTK